MKPSKMEVNIATRDGHKDIFADAHRCGYPHYPTYIGYSAIYAAHISDKHPIRIRMAIPNPDYFHERRFVLDLSSWFLINISCILKGARPSWRPRLALRKKSCSLPETSDSSADVLGSSLDPINTQLYNVVLFFCYLC